MINTKTQFVFCVCICMIHDVVSQAKDSVIFLIEQAPVVDTRPNEPVRIFSTRLPFRIAPIASKHEISLDYHAGNTWNPSGVLEYPNANEPYPVHPWNATYHPSYSIDPHRYQLYSADGVIRSVTVSYIQRISLHEEVYATLNANMLVGGGSFIDALVSDRTIENLHRVLFHQNDPFLRLQNPLNRAEVQFVDRDGRSFEMKPQQIYLGTANVGYRHFVNLIRKNKILWMLNLETQTGLPLTRAREFLSAGIMIGTSFTKQITKKYGITLAIGYSGQDDKLLRVRPKRFDPDYAGIVTGYRFLLGQNFDFKNNQRFTIGIELQGMTAPLNTKIRVDAPYLNPEDIGIQTAYPPEYWTPQHPINVTNQRRAARSLIRGSEYVALNFSYRFGKSGRAPTIAFYLQEDWTVIYDTEGTVLPLFTESNNAQDFGAGIKFIQPIP